MLLIRLARQVNLLHPAKQEPGQVQIANHEWMILLSVCDPRAQRFIREQKAAHSSAPPQAGGTHTAYFAAMTLSEAAPTTTPKFKFRFLFEPVCGRQLGVKMKFNSAN